MQGLAACNTHHRYGYAVSSGSATALAPDTRAVDCRCQDLYAGSPGQHFATPPRASAAAYEQQAMSALSVPASALETAGKQDEVGRQGRVSCQQRC